MVFGIYSARCPILRMKCSHSTATRYQVGYVKERLYIHITDVISGSQPPSLLVSVSGTVVHGKGPSGNPAATPSKSVDGQPRVFSQTFMLVPDSNAPKVAPGEVAKYYVNADSVRFVG